MRAKKKKKNGQKNNFKKRGVPLTDAAGSVGGGGFDDHPGARLEAFGLPVPLQLHARGDGGEWQRDAHCDRPLAIHDCSPRMFCELIDDKAIRGERMAK